MMKTSFVHGVPIRCILVIAGLLAAIIPARRAANLNILEALSYE